VQVTKTLRVVLSTARPLWPRSRPSVLRWLRGREAGAQRAAPAQESGKDIAILKIDARSLPTIALGDSDRVELGQPIHILGFPGVVLYHELLDKRSAVEASVTSGRVSSLKRDARGAPVIQTDAAASWGNSGGPAINERGEVVGILTFISVTADESQSVQGFNFLVPANTSGSPRGAGVSLEPEPTPGGTRRRNTLGLGGAQAGWIAPPLVRTSPACSCNRSATAAAPVPDSPPWPSADGGRPWLATGVAWWGGGVAGVGRSVRGGSGPGGGAGASRPSRAELGGRARS
jgi:hypothetical protein